ncbi:MAG: VIT1/CCC1 transporter family protein [Limnochordaceae bacterium]|nr:VIT1/CCC1 transporter family protein [Limnochordaceae bacterium]
MSRLQQARKAYETRDVEAAKALHAPEAIRAAIAPEKHEEERGKYLSDAVYGASDGIVTTFAVVAGVAGASLSPVVVVIMGLANLFGDGFSMAAGAYLSGRSEQDYQRQEREREAWEIQHFPEGERQEIRDIYAQKGFQGEDLERAVEVITSDRERWLTTMMREELGIIEERKDPMRAALTTFFAFVAGGTIPLLGYLLAARAPGLSTHPFGVATAVTLASMFGVGAARSIVTHRPWWRTGLEMLGVGSLAAAVAYLVGFLLKGLA